MKRLWFGLFAVLALRASAAPLGILVPAYFDPSSGLWSGLNFAASRVPLIAIMNPNNGPGLTQNASYVSALSSLHAAGGRVIGYVYSSYATRATNTVKADIDLYFSFYAVDGIFVDEMTNDADTNHLNYYATLYQYIQTKGTNLLVAGNPGINTLETYLTRPTADLLVTFESNSGYTTLTVDGWVTNHLARQFSHLPYNVPDAGTMTNYVNLAASRNAGWIYVTDDILPNPWDTLPSYWTNEVNYIRSLNQSAPGTRLSIATPTNGRASLQVSGAPGVYEIQATSNLVNWSAIGIISSSSNLANFTDSASINLPRRSYRTRQ
jgi:spherulation-specific family 4 protein